MRGGQNVPHAVTVPPYYGTGASVPFPVTASLRRIGSYAFTLRGINLVESAYAIWLGQPVVLQVTAGDLTVPLRGTIIGESSAAVRFRVGEGWDVDIFKAMILAVEEDNWASVIT